MKMLSKFETYLELYRIIKPSERSVYTDFLFYEQDGDLRDHVLGAVEGTDAYDSLGGVFAGRFEIKRRVTEERYEAGGEWSF